jgi:two-component system, NtrC family, response regulator AtoC
MLTVLIVEDDADARAALHAWIERQGHSVEEAETLEAARASLAARPCDLVLVDLELPDGSGLELAAELRDLADTDCVIVSGKATVESAIEALRLGARDFLPKPVELPRLQSLLQIMARATALRREVRQLRGELKRLGRFGDMVGVSPAMQRVYEALERVAPTDETVLVTGETGTGKELTAATIHRLSRRTGKPFVALNCGGVAPTLIESELFGHERGAFTGADRLRKGVFEQADGGTLFLDEITEMPPEMQVKLLRVLETFKVTRVGGNTELSVDVRIVAATNRDPHEAVRAGALRQDLLYRLLVFPVALPPLRDRRGDVAQLAEIFLRAVDKDREGEPRSFTAAAQERLAAYRWPGNVRELRNVVRRAAIMATGETIDVRDLPLEGTPAPAVVTAGAESPQLRPGMTVEEAERKLIEATLAHADGDKRQAAEMLGISLKTLYTRLKVYDAARSATAAAEARDS